MLKHVQIITCVITLSACAEYQGSKFDNPRIDCGDYATTVPNNLPIPVKAEGAWAIMGSSSAFGAGASSYSESWAGQLTDKLGQHGVAVENTSKGGYTTYHALPASCDVPFYRKQPDPEHNLDKALSYEPRVVVMSYPSNDAASGYTAREAAANVLLMRQKLADKNIPLVVISAQPRPLSADGQEALLGFDTLLNEAMGPCFVNVYDKLHGTDGKLVPEYDHDTVHVTNAGHDVIYQALAETINSKQCIAVNGVEL
ncbi:lysophospholipase L1-like esterase [Idiomarina aquatica]|uniref:Lysophospholipase L1-like esterase n=1 Tax=Idiomarina aquatica TaxID=1327752 RepID=A0A4V3CQ15_9GAMM|nr:SGNH/GDSL hydrolase family protein [Idiomarina aquatica]TDP40220.1 lysophospholipase L1-like esterase [Idiomarina aquatica]